MNGCSDINFCFANYFDDSEIMLRAATVFACLFFLLLCLRLSQEVDLQETGGNKAGELSKNVH